MAGWQIASGLFFVYIAGAAAGMRGLDAARRRLAITGAVCGLMAAVGTSFTPPPAFAILNDWIVPPLVLLLAYWTSGLLFVAPMPRAERVLIGIDRTFGIRGLAAAVPRPIAELLEIAYAAVYPVIPAALILHLTLSTDPDAGRFWTVILATDCVCFGMLPWIQTRPPRALEPEPPWSVASRVRAFNLRLLGSASIQANTFPSGHAAEALAAALLVLDLPAAVVIAMFVVALAISAGAVLGRYHYAADALAGWAVAAGVWLLMAGVR